MFLIFVAKFNIDLFVLFLKPKFYFKICEANAQ